MTKPVGCFIRRKTAASPLFFTFAVKLIEAVVSSSPKLWICLVSKSANWTSGSHLLNWSVFPSVSPKLQHFQRTARAQNWTWWLQITFILMVILILAPYILGYKDNVIRKKKRFPTIVVLCFGWRIRACVSPSCRLNSPTKHYWDGHMKQTQYQFFVDFSFLYY